ncbi:MAG: flavodoxin domain-containing protein [Actinobacteria bacterium]|nr:flavodoxin domain-containing protein [Actinomycetota bacterium]
MESQQRPDAPPETATSRTAVAAPARILVTFATRHGSTAEVAEWIAEELREAGAEVDVTPVDAGPHVSDYQAVVLGGPMIMGWHKRARRFLGVNAATLADMPTALFITAAALTETVEDALDGIPIVKDPWLVKELRTPGKPTRKERYARPGNYLKAARRAAPDVRPVSVAFFAGSLDLTSMNLFEKLFIMLVIGATPGDARNRKAVRHWARDIAPKLRGA